MRRYLVVLFTLISFFSCSKHNSDVSIILDKADNYIEEHPDSSLIRSKLGIQSANIDTYLLNKMNELR